MRLRVLLMLLALATVGVTGVALGKASHRGWPHRDGRLIIHKADQSSAIWGLPDRHNELLGGHGSDTIHAGRMGDIIWGDYKPCCQPTSQVDHLYGGPGRDFIYTSHGRNLVWTGGGRDVVHAHFGRGVIHCQSPGVVVWLSHRSRRHYRLIGCHHLRFH